MMFLTLFRRRQTDVTSVQPAAEIKRRNQAQRLHREAHVYYLAFKHPRVRWHARLVAACCAGYLLSPIQLIPSYIPVIGFSDDFLVLYLGAKLLQRIIPPEVFAECRRLADEAEMRRDGEIKSRATIVVFAAIVAVWMLATVGASILMVRYFSTNRVMAK